MPEGCFHALSADLPWPGLFEHCKGSPNNPAYQSILLFVIALISLARLCLGLGMLPSVSGKRFTHIIAF